MSGRGAWSAMGRGGTLRRTKDETTLPGPYYLLAVGGVPKVGSTARDTMRAGHTPNLDTLAVMFGVKALQRLLNAASGVVLDIDGVFGRVTDSAVRVYQNNEGLTTDGSAGPRTMTKLLLPHIRKLGGSQWSVVYGLLKNEGAFDPGAVGTLDEHDLGLAQINGPAHPTMSMAQRFDPFVAIQFNVDYLNNALRELGNIRDAVLAYNLGIGGVYTWIKVGRPRYYSPDGGPERDTTMYVNRVLDAYKVL
jgi:peptidoglycan hydrolase-like protein with peptidoglycan-binding domain